MPLVGKPCGRPGCEHGQGLHDEEGCCFCSCGYFLQTDILTETRMTAVISDALDPRRTNDTHLYGFLRVVEGYSHERAHALVKGYKPRKPRKTRAERARAIGDALTVQA